MSENESSSPASYVKRLPPEILVEVFKLLGPRKPSYPSIWTTSLDEPRALSQVCTSWRALALDVKSLWTGIPVMDESWAELSLQRSRPLPVVVAISVQYVFDYTAGVELYDRLCRGILKALSETQRIRVLEIDICADDSDGLSWLTDEIFTALEAGPMPVLEYVDVDLHWTEVNQRHPSFLGQITPEHLIHLGLRSFERDYFPCPHLFAAPLTSLELGYGHIWESVEDALVVLSSIPTLETLKLSRGRDDDNPNQPGPIPDFNLSQLVFEPRSIALPRLELLVLHEPLVVIACLMKYLVFPASARIELSTLGKPNGAGVVRPVIETIISSLSAHYGTYIAEDRQFHGLLLEMDEYQHQRRLIVAADHVLCNQDVSTPRACYIPIRYSKPNRDSPIHIPGFCYPFSMDVYDDDTFSALDLIEMFINLPIFKSARALTFTENSYPIGRDPLANTLPSQWKNVISRLNCVSVVHLYGYTAMHALQALTEEDGITACRFMTELIVQEVSFVPPPEAAKSKPAYIPFDTFFSVLRKRFNPEKASTLTPLSRLKIKSCDIDDTQVAQLRCSFGKDFLRWDEEVRGTYESHARAELNRRGGVRRYLKSLE